MVVLISYLSPYGMMEKTAPYQDNPVTDYLKENLDISRPLTLANDYFYLYTKPRCYKSHTLHLFS